jgi:uncharacterized protein
MLFWVYRIASLRKSVAFIVALSFLTVTYLALAIGEFSSRPVVTKAGGALGICVGLCGYYIGLSELLAAERKSVFRLPLGIL